MTDAKGILIVEDDPDIGSALKRGLESHGYTVHHTEFAKGALELLTEESFEAGIFDVMIGEDSGLELVRDARAQGIKKPIIMLSALADVEDRTRGIEAGANDYVVKPFVFDELLARLQVQLIREPAKPTMIEIDADQQCMTFDGDTVQLTIREYQLMEFLFDRQGSPVSRWEIYDSLWPGDGKASENIVDVYIGYIRKKLAMFPESGPEIKTIRNKGFMLKASD